MRILWVKPGKLLPLDTGGKLRTYNILRHLCSRHEVTFLSYYGGLEDHEYEKEIAHRLPGSFPVLTSASEPRGWTRYFDYALRLPSPYPYAVGKFKARKVQDILNDWFPRKRFDVAICDFLCSAPNFPDQLTTLSVLFQHNVESLLWERRARFASSLMERAIARIESLKMSRYESSQVRRFHHVLAVSEQDKHAMNEMVDPSHISVVPTGVDLGMYQSSPSQQSAEPLVMFTGSMDWEPNIDGAEFFCREVWPRVLAAIPNARFRIVGRNPHPRVQKLAGASVEVTGTVPSIVDHLREAAVLVVPLRMGGGTRIKIYEGMAMSRATVSTHVGAEGLDVENERDILLADEPEIFASHVIKLIQNIEFRRQVAKAAHRTAGKYDWSVIAKQFADILAKLSATGAQNAPGI